MSVTLRWGGTSDVGQVREVNEDSYLIGAGYFVVADGMGGHAAGDVASGIAVDTIESELDAVEPTPTRRVLDLVTAVQSANEQVYARSEDDPSLAGMGTTVVAIGLVQEDGEERIAIVNVGDSRAYRLSGGELDQVSDDHSLVGELYREGRITAEEAQHHPQKNIVTRAIGIEPYVEVDEFQLLPRTGDRYLLCSDGLTDEVEATDIARVLRTVDDPDEAAAELVRLANEHGGRDNITIVIVDVVDDGGIAEGASAAAARASVPDDDDFSEHPDENTERFLAVPDDQAHTQGRSRARTRAGRGGAGTDRNDVSDDEPRAPRAITLRSLGFVVAVLAVLGVCGALGYNAIRNTYFVGIEDDEVVVFQGRPGGFLWFDPTFVEGTDIAADDVPEDVLVDLEDGVSHGTLGSARRYVDNLEERIEDLTPPVTTTTTTTTTPTSSTSTTTPAAGATTSTEAG